MKLQSSEFVSLFNIVERWEFPKNNNGLNDQEFLDAILEEIQDSWSEELLKGI